MRAPDIAAGDRAAWLLNPAKLRANYEGKVASETLDAQIEATAAGWLIFWPGCHAVWSWWYVGAVSLVDVPGLPPARKTYAAAEWELHVAALDPDIFPNDLGERDVESESLPIVESYLSPPDFVFQFDGLTKPQTTNLVGLYVTHSVVFGLPPDSDHARGWTAAMRAAVEQFKAGAHDPN